MEWDTVVTFNNWSVKWLQWFLSITNLMHFFWCIYLFHFSTCCEQHSAHQENWHTRQSPTQSNIYQMMY